MGASPSLVNDQGQSLSAADYRTLYGSPGNPGMGQYRMGATMPTPGMDPTRRDEMLRNWLTSGGPPKPLDPFASLGADAAISGARQKAMAGMGMSGLFGFAKFAGMPSLPGGLPAIPAMPGGSR